MNPFSALIAVALLTYTTSATPCANICKGKCTLQKETCQFSQVFGKLCIIVNGVCTKSCDAACGCADSCAAKCGEEFATCKGGDGNKILNLYSCGIGLSVCSASCHAKCNFNLFANIVEIISGGNGLGSS